MDACRGLFVYFYGKLTKQIANMQEINSQNANLILKKLKKSLKISTDIQLSEILNVKPNTISTWKKRNSLDYSCIISICELYEIDLNYIFSHESQNKSNEYLYSCETPLVSSEVQFQYCIDKSSLMDSLPKYNFPFVKNFDTKIFQVSSNNMYPVIELNSFVICELTDIDTVKENSIIVVISKTRGLFINRISKNSVNKDTFVFNNENTFYNSILFKRFDINEVWLVKGILSYNLKDENQVDFVHGVSSHPNAVEVPSKIKGN